MVTPEKIPSVKSINTEANSGKPKSLPESQLKRIFRSRYALVRVTNIRIHDAIVKNASSTLNMELKSAICAVRN
jgi:hypothetical protein